MEKAEAAAIGVLEGFAQQPVTDEEVERARTRLLTHIEQTFADPEHFGVALSGAIAAGDWRLFFLAREDLRKVTAADVQRVALAWLKPSNRTLGRFIPEDHSEHAPAPALADVGARLRDFHPAETVAQGEAFEPTPDNIEAHLQRVTLPGGLKLALLPKRNRGETVAVRLQLHWGDATSLLGLSDAGQFATAMIDRGGAGLTRQEIRARFDRLQARVGFGGGATGVTVSIETVRAHLPETLRLVGQLLRQPAYPQSEFNQLKAEMLAGIEESRKDPQSVAVNAIEVHLNHYPKGDLRYAGTPDEDIADIEAVTRDQVASFQQRFFSASHGEVAVIGDFDVDAVQGAIADGLGKWPATLPYAPVFEDYLAPRPARLLLETPDKANASSTPAWPCRCATTMPTRRC